MCFSVIRGFSTKNQPKHKMASAKPLHTFKQTLSVTHWAQWEVPPKRAAIVCVGVLVSSKEIYSSLKQFSHSSCNHNTMDMLIWSLMGDKSSKKGFFLCVSWSGSTCWRDDGLICLNRTCSAIIYHLLNPQAVTSTVRWYFTPFWRALDFINLFFWKRQVYFHTYLSSKACLGKPILYNKP